MKWWKSEWKHGLGNKYADDGLSNIIRSYCCWIGINVYDLNFFSFWENSYESQQRACYVRCPHRMRPLVFPWFWNDATIPVESLIYPLKEHSLSCSLKECSFAVGHYKCQAPCIRITRLGDTRICQRKFEFWAQKMGGTDNERVVRSKKRHFLTFFVNYCLTDGYTDFYL